MQVARHLIPALALVVLSAPSFASVTTYTSSASFLTHVAPGSYTETFTGLNPPAGPVSFAGSGFAYDVSATGDLYSAGDFVETSLPNQALTINFTSGNVLALGGNFFAVDLNDDFVSTSIKLTLSDGTVTTFTPGSMVDSYRGFTANSSGAVITSLVMSGPGVSRYAAFDNITVGLVIPEPTSFALAGLGLAGLFAARRRVA